jgi:hypothetical protein
MPLIPPLFVQSNSAFDSLFGTGNHTESLAFTSNVTQGDLLYVYVSGITPTISSGSPTGDTLTLNGLSDTRGNLWNNLASDVAAFNDGGIPPFNAAQYHFSVYFAFAKDSGPCTVQASWSATGGFTQTLRLNIAECKNVSTFDQFSSGFSTSNPAVTPTPAVSTSNNELYIAAEGYGLQGPSFTPGIWGGLSWNNRIGPGSPSIGPVWDALIGPTGGDPTPSLTAGNTNHAKYWTSVAVFRSATATDPNNGNVFLSQYPGMPWMKNVAFLCRNYWDVGLSQPTVGQEWPVPNTGGAQSGKTYPY